MQRITKADLEGVCRMINKLTGSPEEPYTKGEDGQWKPNGGCFHLDWAYGGVGLQRMAKTGSGTEKILGGFMPKRELYEKMHAMIQGIHAGTKNYAA